MDNNSNEFLALKKKWYDKLKDTGFDDAENFDGRLITAHGSDAFQRSREHGEFNRVKAEYYRLAGFFLHDHRFSSPLQKVIWKQHSEGLSVRDISASLFTKHSITKSKSYINNIIRQLAVVMRIKYKEMGNEYK